MRHRRSVHVWIAAFIAAFAAVGASARVVVKDDFESGRLDRWTPVTGRWEIVIEGGNRIIRTIPEGPGEFRALNLSAGVFKDFTMEARIRQASQDHGANLYFRHDLTKDNPAIHSGYWFGISGALDAIGWGAWKKGGQTVDDVLFSPVLLDWIKLRLEAKGGHISMWAQREGVDPALQLVFELEDIAASTGIDLKTGHLGFIVAGAEVWIDDVTVETDSLDASPAGKAAASWAELKRNR